jgi:hypothetical protein
MVRERRHQSIVDLRMGEGGTITIDESEDDRVSNSNAPNKNAHPQSQQLSRTVTTESSSDDAVVTPTNFYYHIATNPTIQRYYRFTSNKVTPIIALYKRPLETYATDLTNNGSTTTTTNIINENENNNCKLNNNNNNNSSHNTTAPNHDTTGILTRTMVLPSHGTDPTGRWILVSVGGRTGWARRSIVLGSNDGSGGGGNRNSGNAMICLPCSTNNNNNNTNNNTNNNNNINNERSALLRGGSSSRAIDNATMQRRERDGCLIGLAIKTHWSVMISTCSYVGG